jgi:hypothetical protein
VSRLRLADFAPRQLWRVLLLSLLSICFSSGVYAQQAQSDEDLDVTMQVLPDPDTKQPNELLQRIPLPKPKSEKSSITAPGEEKKENDKKEQDSHKSDNTDKSDIKDERGDTDQGRDASDSAKDQAKEAREQRNEARREENRREREEHPEPPKEHPGHPRH